MAKSGLICFFGKKCGKWDGASSGVYLSGFWGFPWLSWFGRVFLWVFAGVRSLRRSVFAGFGGGREGYGELVWVVGYVDFQVFAYEGLE